MHTSTAVVGKHESVRALTLTMPKRAQESLSYSRRLPARALKKKHSLKLKFEVRQKKTQPQTKETDARTPPESLDHSRRIPARALKKTQPQTKITSL